MSRYSHHISRKHLAEQACAMRASFRLVRGNTRILGERNQP